MSFILFKLRNNEVLRFIFIGFLNTAVDFGVLNLLFYIFNDIKLYTFFKSISFILAVLNSYIFNKYWVFLSHSKPTFNESGKFLAFNLLGLLLNLGVSSGVLLSLLFLFSNASEVLIINISAFCGSLAVAIMNFLSYKYLVFKKVEIIEKDAQ